MHGSLGELFLQPPTICVTFQAHAGPNTQTELRASKNINVQKLGVDKVAQ